MLLTRNGDRNVRKQVRMNREGHIDRGRQTSRAESEREA